jgi:hypothetical protein
MFIKPYTILLTNTKKRWGDLFKPICGSRVILPKIILAIIYADPGDSSFFHN